VDKGPWVAVFAKGEGWCLWSDDFEHDVILYIRGDFADADQKQAYAEWLAATLNGAAPMKEAGQ